MARVGKKGNNFGRGIAGIWQRELGDLSPRNFAHRVGASEVISEEAVPTRPSFDRNGLLGRSIALAEE